MSVGNYWRARARKVIGEVVSRRTDLHLELPLLIKEIQKAYPFGQRKWTPYKIWCEEVAKAREEIASRHPEVYNLPLHRKCMTCGAKPMKPCRKISEDDAIIVTRDERKAVHDIAMDAERSQRIAEASTILLEVYHASRMAAVRRITLGSGPLFGEAS